MTGQYVNEDKTYLVKFLNTIGAALGCKNAAGNGPLDDFNADNNNYRSKNYTNTYYFPQFPPPADGAPPITGRIAQIMM